jgi:phosphoenolpyruvate carboxykinase (GTP)
MIGRVKGEAGAVDTPIGAIPSDGDINLEGVSLSPEARTTLFGFDRAGWQREFADLEGFLAEFGDRMPDALKTERRRVAEELAD